MRWYDLEPDVCMAISMIECAPPNAQVEYAEYIIKLVKEKDKDFDYMMALIAYVLKLEKEKPGLLKALIEDNTLTKWLRQIKRSVDHEDFS